MVRELYTVVVTNSRESVFKEHYTKEEILIIKKFLNDMKKHNVASYDVPTVVFKKWEQNV